MATRTVANAKKTSARQHSKGGATPVKFRYHRPNKWNTKYPVNRLPFVVRREEGGLNYWAFPSLDGYGAGCDMGSAAATAFLKALRASDGDCGGYLQMLVHSAISAGEHSHGQRGVVVGFFSTLDHWLGAAARMLGSSLDDVAEADLQARMERAANTSEAVHTAQIEAKARELGLGEDE